LLKRNLLISHSRKTIIARIPHSTNFEYIVYIINWNSPFGNLMNLYQTAKIFQLKEFLFETKCDFLTMSYQMTIKYKFHCFTLVWNLRNVKRKLMCHFKSVGKGIFCLRTRNFSLRNVSLFFVGHIYQSCLKKVNFFWGLDFEMAFFRNYPT
jgi:hypothetical protein